MIYQAIQRDSCVCGRALVPSGLRRRRQRDGTRRIFRSAWAGPVARGAAPTAVRRLERGQRRGWIADAARRDDGQCGRGRWPSPPRARGQRRAVRHRRAARARAAARAVARAAVRCSRRPRPAPRTAIRTRRSSRSPDVACGGRTGPVRRRQPQIDGRDMIVTYPCDKHAGAPVTFILNLHGTTPLEHALLPARLLRRASVRGVAQPDHRDAELGRAAVGQRRQRRRTSRT